MRARIPMIAALAMLAIIAGWAVTGKSAEDQPNTPSTTRLPSYLPTVDRIMDMIGHGKIDDALISVDILKEQPNAREAIRNRLIHLNTEQQHYFGYDIVALQRFSPRLQIASVVAYYDQQPILFQFNLYHPQTSPEQQWIILGLQMHEHVAEELKDVPIDYPGHPSQR